MLKEDVDGKWQSQSVNATCDECQAEYKARISTAKRQKEIVGHHQCRKCSSRRAGKKTAKKMSKIYSELYSGDGNPSRRPGVAEKISKALKGISFSDAHKKSLRKPKSKTEQIKLAANKPEEVARRRSRMLLNNPAKRIDVREKISRTISELHISGKFAKGLDKGWTYSSKTPSAIYCRSGSEKMFIELASKEDRVKAIESAEFMKIPYLFNGSIHHYLPDFQILMDSGETVVVEIKNPYLQKMAKSQAKAATLEKHCSKVGIGWKVLTEEEIFDWLRKL